MARSERQASERQASGGQASGRRASSRRAEAEPPARDEGGSQRGGAGTRRGRIRAALHRCIREKGYAAVTLREVAAAAGMSASHLLYYYPSKDAVLVDLFERASRNMLRDVHALPAADAAEGCRALADYFFGPSRMSRGEQGFMLELFGLATHHEALRRVKADFDRRMKARLAALLERGPGAGVAPEEGAEIALAALVGLLTSTYFDERPDPARAHRLFGAVLARLSGAELRAAPGRRAGPGGPARSA